MENSVTVYSGTAGSWTKGDKLKIKKHGFDTVTSFRKSKEI